MIRLILFLLGIAALATGLSWLADRPGEMVVNWQGYEIQTTVFRAVVMFSVLLAFCIFLYSLARSVWQSPAAVGHFLNRRRQQRGLDALSSGMIAIGAGDRSTATRYAIQARKSLPNEPLTHLLRAQAAQLSGDKATARRIFEAMLASPDTEQLGLRGLFLEAEHEGEREAARQFAERAVRLNPKLSWPVDALFELQCKQRDWPAALDTLSVARKNGHIDKKIADRRRAVLLTAQSQAAEDADPERALSLAIEAHNLANDLVPAAAIAARLLASRGNTGRATKIVQRAWSRAPHPDLARAYAYARIGDSPRDRLDRIRQLAALTPNSIESPVALATAAIEAKDFDTARKALEPLMDGRLTHRICLLIARIEGEQHGDKGRVREWFARAVNAPRDPAWTADGVTSDQWQPVSPVTGRLDAFEWRVPVEQMEKSEGEMLARKLDELVALGAPDVAEAAAETLIDAKAVPTKVTPAARPAADEAVPTATVAAATVPTATSPAATGRSEQKAAPAAGNIAPAKASPADPAPAQPRVARAEIVAAEPAPSDIRSAAPAQPAATEARPPSAPVAPKRATVEIHNVARETPAAVPAPASAAKRGADVADYITPDPVTAKPKPEPAASGPTVAKPAPAKPSAAAPATSYAKPDPARFAAPEPKAARPAPMADTKGKPTVPHSNSAKPFSEAAKVKAAPQHNIFVSGRAPDDPGPEAGDVDEPPKSPLRTIRATGTP